MLLPRLRDTLKFFWQYLAELLWLLAPVLLPLLLLADYRLFFVHAGKPDPQAMLADPLLLLPQLLASVLATAATVSFTTARLRGEKPAFAALWLAALRAFPALAVVQILSGLAIACGLVPASVVLANAAANPLALFGGMLLALPGLFLMGALLPSYVLAVDGRPGPLRALKMSWQRFYRQAWMVTAGLSLLGLLLLVVVLGLGSIAQLLVTAPEALRLAAHSGLQMVSTVFMQLIAIFLVFCTRPLPEQNVTE